MINKEDELLGNHTSPSSQRFSKCGFTLIELIVVIVIIGILAIIVIAAFSNIPDRAENGANLAIARTIFSAAAASEATSSGAHYTIAELVSNGLLESKPGAGFSVSYSALDIQVTYPVSPSGTKTYPE